MKYLPKQRCCSLFVLIAALLCTASTGVANEKLTAAEQAAGWIMLFDGSDTSAWRGYRRAAFPEQGWIIEDGCLKVTAGGGGGDIITKAQYRNFELSLEWKVSEGANSGIMYRTTEEYDAPWQSAPEMQVLDDAGYDMAPTASNAAGGLYALYDCAEEKVTRPVGEFNTARIVLRDGVVKHYLNGIKVCEADLNSDDWAMRVAASKFASYEGFGNREVGHLCLQDHGNDVWFRNIRVRNLDAPLPGAVDLFAGDRLDQWTYHLRDGASIDDVFSFNDGVLECKGMPIGYIRTNAVYENFVLRLQWRFDPVTKKAGNSGVLLRMIGDDEVWPHSVEAQLMSGSAGDFWNIGEYDMKTDESRLRGRNTKRTHTNEREIGQWNTYEIIVNGGDVTLIVNDEVLNTAWDVTEQPGHICLQSEGAAIHFRNMSLSEIK